MATEVEAKLKVDSHEAVRGRLRALGAEPRGQVLEVNHIFDNAHRSMLAGDRGLRLRECRDERGELVRAVLTYKGPRVPGSIKRREEIEIVVDDPVAAGTMLERLGFVEAVRFEKRRETWRLNGCLVELDEVPYLGLFVEIEGPDEGRIEQVRGELGLSGAPLVHGSYIGLLVRHCEEHGLPVTCITFE
ncbi:MAG TPA: class IV adenylate cyclase [Phycisphaerae bacterium]|jgi:adenylate cyclase class 2|nr:class IV adenylate cyclase [Phycisphaerae bacterium]HOB76029.1 class IV adenylate cyclase [Phycisphaerae bacterium]HOJ53470.1 class IV adenylate cyclase [Phycisphaerae bacterium]HOL25373.1 class IV adenylate cyclase [Phycisphaerae bacterium]HPP21877.1 class IV adenylate cyclase [Phycisphaerae bacterium]